MNLDEQKALLTIALCAAFADGTKADAERDEIRRITESLPGAAELNLAALYQDVLLRRVTVEGASAKLATTELRQLAYELAAGVCDADGTQSTPERDFLSGLRAHLGLAAAAARDIDAKAEALAAAPLGTATTIESTATAAPPGSGSGGPVATTMPAADMDRMILNYAILNGALELLPDSVASMAIIPLQLKMVYRIGKAYGYELDRGHVKDFLATAGVGLTSQYVEQIGAKLIGQVLGRIGGGLLGGLGRQATSSAFSFATTWALGNLAKRYYAAGRTLSTDVLRDAFSALVDEARTLQQRYATEIVTKARTIDVRQLWAELGAKTS